MSQSSVIELWSSELICLTDLLHTHPLSQERQSWDYSLLGDALQDPGCAIQATHARGQGGDIEAQQEKETHQGDLEGKILNTGEESA